MALLWWDRVSFLSVGRELEVLKTFVLTGWSLEGQGQRGHRVKFKDSLVKYQRTAGTTARALVNYFSLCCSGQ